MDVAALRSEFPVFDELAYLNTGSNGPIPLRASIAADEAISAQLEQGRGGREFFDGLMGAADSLRDRMAGVMGCATDELVLTGSTTDGVNAVVSGLDLGPDDEVLTSNEEHPGLLAPLAIGARRRGFRLRHAPFAGLADEVGSATLVACSHVSWITGQVADTEALAASRAMVLLDGAQGLGAIPLDVHRLGCDFYAASGQKWMCGPVGSGYLFVHADRVDALTPAWPNYGSVASPERPLDSELREGAARLGLGLRPYEHSAWAAASLDVLEAAGLDGLMSAAADGAEGLAGRLREVGRTVAPRGRTTLVSWEEDEPESTALRLREDGVVVRWLPGWPYLRASVGGWTTEEDLDRLVAGLG